MKCVSVIFQNWNRWESQRSDGVLFQEGGSVGGGWSVCWTPQSLRFYWFFIFAKLFAKILILGDLSNRLFGLVFLCPTSEEMRVRVIGPPHTLPPLPYKTVKKCCSRTFYICLCLCLHIHRHLLGNLVLHFWEWNLNKCEKLCIFP